MALVSTWGDLIPPVYDAATNSTKFAPLLSVFHETISVSGKVVKGIRGSVPFQPEVYYTTSRKSDKYRDARLAQINAQLDSIKEYNAEISEALLKDAASYCTPFIFPPSDLKRNEIFWGREQLSAYNDKSGKFFFVEKDKGLEILIPTKTPTPLCTQKGGKIAYRIFFPKLADAQPKVTRIFRFAISIEDTMTLDNLEALVEKVTAKIRKQLQIKSKTYEWGIIPGIRTVIAEKGVPRERWQKKVMIILDPTESPKKDEITKNYKKLHLAQQFPLIPMAALHFQDYFAGGYDIVPHAGTAISERSELLDPEEALDNVLETLQNLTLSCMSTFCFPCIDEDDYS